MVSHRPADDPTAEGIEHDGEIQEAGPGRNVGDVSDPELIRPLGAEVALDQIGRRSCIAIAHGGHDPLAPANAPNARSRINRAIRLPDT